MLTGGKDDAIKVDESQITKQHVIGIVMELVEIIQEHFGSILCHLGKFNILSSNQYTLGHEWLALPET